MITGTVRGSEAFEVESTVRGLLADPAVAVSDTAETFEVAARAWLVHHRAGCSETFADYVWRVARAQQRVRTVRLEVTASELAQLADLLATMPATMAAAALRTKVTDAFTRLGLQPAEPQDTRPGPRG
jgi:hypothetical protein